MKRKTTISKQTRIQGQRSKTRLGDQTVLLETAMSTSPLGVKPAIAYWKVNQGRILGFGVGLLMIWVGYLLFTMPDFYLYSATIQGNQILSHQEIYDVAGVDTMSIFWVNPTQVKANIEALPNIKTVDVYLTLPANLTIQVQERQPTIIWHTAEATWWIDDEGLFVPPRGEAELAAKKLEIIDLDASPVQVNDQIDVSIVTGAQLIHKYKPEVQRLYYRQRYGLIYTTPEDWSVYLGRTDNLTAKIQVADALRLDLLTRQVTPAFIDVRNPLRAVYQEQEK